MANQLVKVGNVMTPAAARVLTPAQYGDLAEVPPELEWLANLTNRKTREAYRIDVQEFSTFAGLRGHAEFRTVTRAHVIAWRKQLETRDLTPSTIRRKLSALSALFDYLCEHNAVAGNPVDGVKRPSLIPTKAQPPRSVMLRPASCSMHLPRTRSRACAIAPFWPPCSIMASAARSSAGCGCVTCIAVKA